MRNAEEHMPRYEMTPGERRQNYALRLGSDEREQLEEAAAKRGEVLSVWLRRVALERARKELAR